MTYLSFLLLFLVPAIGILAILVGTRVRTLSPAVVWKWIGVIASIAFVYTTPWDNYLVFREVWFYGLDRVIATIGYVPIEEYAFFLLQPVLTGLFTSLVIDATISGRAQSVKPPPPTHWRTAITSAWVAVSLLGFFLLSQSGKHPAYTYLGLILSWACPVLAGMSWLSAHTFWRFRRAIIFAITVPTVYLWIADRFAISRGIWDISNTYSLDFDPLGLPVEEAIFFLLTNVLVVQGLVMFLPLSDRPSSVSD